MMTARLDRYPGLRPFADTPEDQALFFGRDAEIDSLFNRIRAVRLLVLFGKSGLGKTSLLRAGVFPRLREHAMFPIEVRVGQSRLGESLIELVAEAAAVACREAQVDFTPGEGETLWEFFKTAMFWRGEELLTPVLVLDQFEEIFTLMEADRRKALAQDIGAIASGIIPESIRERPRAVGKAAALGTEPPDVKIVLSLREVYVGALQELSDDIPGIFQDRVRLAPMTEVQARDAIQRPATLERITLASGESQDFAKSPFEYGRDALDDMLDVLMGKSGTIEPFQLQMLCQHIEQRVAAVVRRPGAIEIKTRDVGGRAGLQKVFKTFYGEKIGALPWRQRRHARELCEMGLLTSDGHRRMLEESEIEKDFRIAHGTLASLVDSGLIRKEKHFESVFYEISHDNLAEPILTSRPVWRRLPKKYRFGIGAVCLAVITVLGVQYHYRTQAETAKTQAESARDRAESLVSFLIGEDLFRELNRIGDIELIEQVQKRINKHYQQALGAPVTPIFQRNRAVAFRNDGDLSRQLGNLPQAKKYYREAKEILQSLSTRDPLSTAVQRESATTLSRLGRVATEQGDLTDALRDLGRSIEIRRTLQRQNINDPRFTADLAEDLRARSAILVSQGAIDAAERDIDASNALLQGKQTDLLKRRWRLLQVHTWVAKARISQLKLARSSDFVKDAKIVVKQYKAALQLATGLAKTDPLDSEALYARAVAANYLVSFMAEVAKVVLTGDMSFQKYVRRFKVTIPRLLKSAEAVTKQLKFLSEAERRNRWRKRDLAVMKASLANNYLQVIPIIRRIVEKHPDAKVKARGKATQEKLAEGAYKLSESAVTTLQGLVNLDPTNAVWRMDLGVAQVQFASMLRQKDRSRARGLASKGLVTMEELVVKDPSNIRWKYNLVNAIGLSLGSADVEQQIEYLEQALKILMQLKEKKLPYTNFDRPIERTKRKLDALRARAK